MKKIVLPLLILVAGFGLAGLIVVTGPKLEPQAPPTNSPLVRTWSATSRTVQMTSITHGTVLPRTESELVPEVSGRIVQISPAMVSGGFFQQGEQLLAIDPLDYQVAVEQAQAAVASAESELTSARRAHTRQQNLARKQSTSESLRDEALNRLRFAQATLRESRARLAKAQRDLTRTRITAPYDGRVRTERVDVGQFVNRGQAVAMLYATDYAEVRLPVHDEELAFLQMPLNNTHVEQLLPTATLRAEFAGTTHTWESRIVRTEGELDPQTRMINIVARVDSPYESKADRPPLSVGLFVEAEILGRVIDGVFVLPRSAIQSNNQVYVIDEGNRLAFRDVHILRIVGEEVYVTHGIENGDTVCLSTITNAIEGMAVRPVETASPPLSQPDNRVAETPQLGQSSS